MSPTEMSIHEFNDQHEPPEPRVLRYYQTDSVAAVLKDWASGIKRVGVVLPTGAGKSTCIAKLISISYHDGHRVVILAHRGELLDQIKKDLIAVDPTIPLEHIGLVRAENDDHTAPIVFAMLQSLAKGTRVAALGKRTRIFWDEVHHAPALGYHASFTALGGYEDAEMCGFTATPYRSSTTKNQTAQIGLGDVIQKISYSRDLRWAVEEGHLVKPSGLTVRIPALDALNKIKNVAGDFNQGELADIMEAAVEYTVDAVEKHASDRRSIIFAASVAAAHSIADLLNEHGVVSAGVVSGAMGYDERQPDYQRFRDGEIQAMVTVAVLTEGADFPMCDCVVLARPTRARVLYSQMVGRALRLFPGKDDALVLDLSGSTRQMKLIHLAELVHGLGIEIKEVNEEGEELEVELCPDTGVAVNLCECDYCVEMRTPEKREKGPQRMGPVDMTPVELLNDSSDTLWLQTPAGVHFIPLDEGWLVFAWPKGGKPECGEFAVGSINTRHGRNTEGGWMPTPANLDLDTVTTGNDGEPYWNMSTALRKAEEWALDCGWTLPARFQSWRRKNQAPSEPQQGLAKRLGIPSYANMTKGRLSDEISIAFASQVLDGTVVRDE